MLISIALFALVVSFLFIELLQVASSKKVDGVLSEEEKKARNKVGYSWFGGVLIAVVVGFVMTKTVMFGAVVLIPLGAMITAFLVWTSIVTITGWVRTILGNRKVK